MTSEKGISLSCEAVSLLLDILEAREPVLSGAAAELSGDAATILKDLDLLRAEGHEDVCAYGNHEDVPTPLIPLSTTSLARFSYTSCLIQVPDRLVSILRLQVANVLGYIGAPPGLPL